MTIYFNGCSHTYGDDLDVPAETAWPTLVAAHYNSEFDNDAQSGGTNDRIVHRTLKNINNYDKFYIAWTNSARFTRRNANEFGQFNFMPQTVDSEVAQNVKLYAKLHYANWYDDLYNFKEWLHQIILLQHVFEKKNLPYVMMNATSNLVTEFSSDFETFTSNIKEYVRYELDQHQVLDEFNEVQNLLGEINFDNFIDWGTWQLMNRKHNPGKLGKTKHHLEDGHEHIAEHILNYEKNKTRNGS